MLRWSAKILLLCFVAVLVSCSEDPNASTSGGRTVVWAWERPEDLRFPDASKFSVAFLSQTLELTGNEVVFIPRRQPLDVALAYAVDRPACPCHTRSNSRRDTGVPSFAAAGNVSPDHGSWAAREPSIASSVFCAG